MSEGGGDSSGRLLKNEAWDCERNGMADSVRPTAGRDLGGRIAMQSGFMTLLAESPNDHGVFSQGFFPQAIG